MAPPKRNTPYIEKSPPVAGNPNQPPVRIINEPPAAGQNVSLEQAVSNSKKWVDAAK
jgi:hypothetical protein